MIMLIARHDLRRVPATRRGVVACGVALVVMLGSAGRADETADPVAAAIDARIQATLTRPSVHDQQPAIERALVAADVPPATIARLFAAVSAADLPGMAGSLDAFLFLTRDPGWLPLRGRFAEFLDLPGVTTLNPVRGRALAAYAGVVSLPDVDSITPETAASLATFGHDDWGAAVEFPAVTAIDADAAAALASCPALLAFPSLRTLSVETARALAGHQGIGIVLGGLASLPPDVATVLAGCQSMQGLLLPDLETLESVPLARRLARQDHVFLPRVTALTPAVAAALRGNEGGELALPALDGIPAELARELVGAGYYWLRLGGGEKLTPEAAAVLAGHNGQLTFAGSNAFSAAAAAELAKHANVISLPHLSELPADVAEALAPHQGTLQLGGLKTLSAESAASLAAHAGVVHLPALEAISPAVAAAFAPRSETVLLSGLRSIDVATAEAFAAHARESLVVGGVAELAPPVAAALAVFTGDLSLPALATLPPEVARALATHRGRLSLHAVGDLSADAATALATHRGDLFLGGIERLSTAAAEALAAAPAALVLPNLSAVTPAGAAALARRSQPVAVDALQHLEQLTSVSIAELLVAGCDDLVLPNLAVLEGPDAVAIARTLATARGGLALPALTRIGPRALESLLAKPGVELPPVEDLDLLPEATGDNDDVVVPGR